MKNLSNISEREVLYARIANQLEEMIVNDRSKIEKKLPSEQRLAESFSVSRPVIREALKILKERGLIESRQGASSVVIEYSTENVLKSLARFTQTKNVSPEQIHQVRTAIELLAVRVACEHVSEGDIQTLKGLNENLKNSDNKTEQAMLDITLHKTIVRLTQNPLLEAIYDSLIDLIKPVIEKSTTKETVEDGVFWHNKIIDALAQGDSERATELMQQHLLLSIRNFEYYNP